MKAIQKLPPEYRLILVLRDMEELSDGDVAEITGLRLGTVRVRLHRARLFVRKGLARRFAGLGSAAFVACGDSQQKCSSIDHTVPAISFVLSIVHLNFR